jgi:NAD(P)H-dependent flavin oxidoreductase YrpB (nitropropane dioxygenase family)
MDATATFEKIRKASLPRVIQGGMGFAVSSYRLASEVSRAGQLGVVSGTGLDVVLARRLQDGDRGGAIRRALAAFPIPAMAARIKDRYFLPEGRAEGAEYAPIPRLAIQQSELAQELSIVGNFVEVWLAKEGHDGLVGVNYLEKLQMATPTATYGAMLAGVDYVLMGAGIPRNIPSLLNDLAEHKDVAFPIDVVGAAPGAFTVKLSPKDLVGSAFARLKRPKFLAIVSAHILATYLARDEHARPDGFVVEGPTAGGHNAPPRGKLVLDETGQPVFGPRDDADISEVAACGLPFWLAGGLGTPEGLMDSEAQGAAGVQVGTLFALSEDSGLDPEIRDTLVAEAREGTLKVRTDRLASPTGFPFKVALVEGSQSDPEVLAARPRLCDIGFLVTAYQVREGKAGYRCPAEPVKIFESKGGNPEETAGRVCLCNALTANVGLPQHREDGYTEKALVTLGTDLEGCHRLSKLYPAGWSARQALDWIIGALPSAPSLPKAFAARAVSLA